MALAKKPLPRPSLKLVFSPESDTQYVHFEHAVQVPFTVAPGVFSRAHAWWMSDASLLSYWDTATAKQRFKGFAGLDSELIETADTQAYVASNEAFVLVAFRGTEPDAVLDLATDVHLRRVAWDAKGEKVHEGFKAALDGVWVHLRGRLKSLAPRPVWFTGHSLGAALATLAGDRFAIERAAQGLGLLGGIYTFGSPLIGDRPFVDGFNKRCGDRSFRFVNDQDTVTRVPPPLLGYRHVNTEHFVGFDDPDVALGEALIDHTPRRYAVLVWNSLVDAGL